MTAPEENHRLFRSATEFPRSIEGIELAEADRLYKEMRAYLVSTNRSQGQLRSYNERYRGEITELKNSRDRLQEAINKLTVEKESIIKARGTDISQLQTELENLSRHLDCLSNAFNGVEDLVKPGAQWGAASFSQRMLDFLRSIRQIVQWWRSENNPPVLPTSQPSLPPSSQVNNSDDRRENPRMHTDPAAINRALRDDVG
jgi:hypothetical protein